jgi:hypothetical protein
MHPVKKVGENGDDTIRKRGQVTPMPKHASNRISLRIISFIDESERVFDRLCRFFDRVAPRAF